MTFMLNRSTSSFEDLKLLDPDLAKSVDYLRTMSDEELVDADYRFAVSNSSGEKELRPGGSEIVVTRENV